MFHIIKQDNDTEYRVEENDLSPNTMKILSKEIRGTFGRKDYAIQWCDYHNGKISKEDHNDFLGIAR